MPAKKLFTLPILTLLMASAICVAMIVYEIVRENRYADLIKSASARYGLDPLLVKAVIKRESNFRPRARGGKGEMGLMQVTPTVGREFASRRDWRGFATVSLYDPPVNIEIGCWYLSKAMRRYGDFADPVPFALAHYNAGASNVDRWLAMTAHRGDRKEFIRAITYPMTRSYVRSILRRWWWYKLFSF